MSTDIEDYLAAADRKNTVRSYSSAVRHFEVSWKGLLPATSESVARYLAEHAPTLRISTLRQRVAALARWHADHGFADPTRSPLVRKVLRGIRATHAAPQKRARPLGLDLLDSVSGWLLKAQAAAQRDGRTAELLRHNRDRSLLLLGFWRAFRADELASMRIEEVEAIRGHALVCRPGRTKTTGEDDERAFHCPALSRLCPVDAYLDWIELSGRTSGPVYPAIDQWGHISHNAMAPSALIPVLRRILKDAGVPEADSYSSHSLRRGFAGWARDAGWDLKDLMEHVGWRDIGSALRYLDAPKQGLKERFERGLFKSESAAPIVPSAPEVARFTGATPVANPEPDQQVAIVHLKLLLSRATGSRTSTDRAQRQIEHVCLKRFAAQKADLDGRRFELRIRHHDRDSLDDTLLDLLEELYRTATDCGALLEADLHEPATGQRWD
ncbi:MAG TPA: tyrosine-type recombinase/integrase [Burkholderiaceae bacterium]